MESQQRVWTQSNAWNTYGRNGRVNTGNETEQGLWVRSSVYRYYWMEWKNHN